MITRDTFPVGTRVSDVSRPAEHGLVVGWRGTTVHVRWDNGGTSSGPASHNGFRHEDAAG